MYMYTQHKMRHDYIHKEQRQWRVTDSLNIDMYICRNESILHTDGTEEVLEG